MGFEVFLRTWECWTSESEDRFPVSEWVRPHPNGTERGNLADLMHLRACEKAFQRGLEKPIAYYAQRGDVIRKFSYWQNPEADWTSIVGGEV